MCVCVCVCFSFIFVISAIQNYCLKEHRMSERKIDRPRINSLGKRNIESVQNILKKYVIYKNSTQNRQRIGQVYFWRSRLVKKYKMKKIRNKIMFRYLYLYRKKDCECFFLFYCDVTECRKKKKKILETRKVIKKRMKIL